MKHSSDRGAPIPLISEDLPALENLAAVFTGGVTSDLLVREKLAPAEDDIYLVAHKMDRSAPTHSHDYYELIYVTGGDVINCVQGEDLYLPNGSLCIMNLKSEHSLEVGNPQTTIVNLCLKPSLFKEGIFKSFLDDDNIVSSYLRGEKDRSYLILSDPSRQTIQRRMGSIARDYAESGLRQSFSLAAHVLLLLSELPKVETYSFYGINQRTMEMLDYISVNSATVTVGSLAQEFGYNESYTSQYIKRHTGRNASQFIVEARLSHARELLQDTTMSAEAIATEVGYRSYSHFHQTFKDHFGCTPKEWREQEQDE